MTNPRYLVTGGAGFIGSHIAQALLAQGEGVRILDDLSTGKAANLAILEGPLDFARGDVRDLETVRQAMRHIEVVFHEAAIASVQQSVADPVETLAVNLIGTQHVLIAAREAGVRRVVLASSAAIYGDPPELPKREDMMPCPISPYAIHKLAGEQLARVFTRLYGLETVALRYFNVFGPRQDPASEYSGVISRFTAALAQGRQPIVYGDGEQTRDFVYVADIVRANLLAAAAPEAVGHAINIGGGTATSLNQMLAVMGGVLGTSIQPIYRDGRPGDIRQSMADITLARRVLGYQPQVAFLDGMRHTLAAMVPDVGVGDNESGDRARHEHTI
ncbi:MAG: SDR family oxidoreductase [Ktedonobacterales bacterium]|nr:SDR family oxidoreductase [Ktedonobacterales bacterium]